MKPAIFIAFFTGQSDLENNALSPAQAAFLARLGGPGRELAQVNFPYAAPPPRPHRRMSLPRASWNNFRQYFSSRGARFPAKHRAAAVMFIERAGRAVFLAGSCGLELFNNLRLPEELEARCTLICYGPVARRRPARARILVAQGRGDWLSRALFRRGAGLQLRGGHMDYLDDPEFLLFCQRQIAQLETASCSNTFA